MYTRALPGRPQHLIKKVVEDPQMVQNIKNLQPLGRCKPCKDLMELRKNNSDWPA